MNAFAKVGRKLEFPNDFCKVISEDPLRTVESIADAIAALNLDKDKIKYALFWFINGSAMDGIALKHLQAGNVEKSEEILQKQDTYSSLINRGVLALIRGDVKTGFKCIATVIHNKVYRLSLFEALGLTAVNEDELAEMFVLELCKEFTAGELLAIDINENDRAIICKVTLEKPISEINAAISVAKEVKADDSEANLKAGTKLMNETKSALNTVKNIVGESSPQYQVVADNLANQILQCGIHYYNNAPDEDFESPRKAMVLQEYALCIAVGKIAKDRCQSNYDILKKAVDNMPPANVARETILIRKEIEKFRSQPEEISYSISLLNATKPLLHAVRAKLGSANSFYLSLSTEVVNNALHNLIEEVNKANDLLEVSAEAIKKNGQSDVSCILSYQRIIDRKFKPALREAWDAIKIMDTFDMESDYRSNRYYSNRQTLKNMCDSWDISTHVATSTPKSTPKETKGTSSSSSSSTSTENDYGCVPYLFLGVIGGFIGAGCCVASGGDIALGAFAGFMMGAGLAAKLFDVFDD